LRGTDWIGLAFNLGPKCNCAPTDTANKAKWITNSAATAATRNLFSSIRRRRVTSRLPIPLRLQKPSSQSSTRSQQERHVVRNRSRKIKPAQARPDTHITCRKICNGSLLFTLCVVPGRQSVRLAEPSESKSQKPGPWVPAVRTPTLKLLKTPNGNHAILGKADGASPAHTRNKIPSKRRLPVQPPQVGAASQLQVGDKPRRGIEAGMPVEPESKLEVVVHKRHVAPQLRMSAPPEIQC
jgi:hypothetical protein